MQMCDFNKVALHFDILTLEFCIFVLLILSWVDARLFPGKWYDKNSLQIQTNYSGEKNSNSLFYFFYYLPIFIY